MPTDAGYRSYYVLYNGSGIGSKIITTNNNRLKTQRPDNIICLIYIMKFIKFTKKKFMKIDTSKIINHDQLLSISKCYRKSGEIKDEKMYIKLCTLIWNYYNFEVQEDQRLDHVHTPFLIGINGSVSSGKTLLAREMVKILRCFPSHPRVMLLSTDNFIYPNKILEKKKIIEDKGFPRSYNWKLLFSKLKKIKENRAVKIPTYNQDVSDIDPKKKQLIPPNIDIIIIEGINILKPYCEGDFDRLLLSDYFDYSVYIDAKERNLKKWFLKRLTKKREYWKKKRIKKHLTQKNKKAFKKFSDKIWNTINRVNLKKYIYPYRQRSDVIIYKTYTHKIKKIELKI